MTRLLRAIGYDNQLGRRLVIASLIVGSVLTVLTTTAQLAASYFRQRSDATLVLDRIQETLASPLEQAVWTFNFAQVNIILDGLASDPNIAYVRLNSSTGQAWSRGEIVGQDTAPDEWRAYELIHRISSDRTEVVGVLEVHLSLDGVRAHVWAQFWTAFLTNLAKAYFAAFALLFIVNRLISRHLRRIVEHVDTAQEGDAGRLRLNRAPRQTADDLDRIVDAITRFEDHTQNQMDALGTEVQERKQAEADAKQALSIRTRFLATMSHEIRTPLNAIMGFLHLIETYKDIEEKPRIYAETATKASHRLMGMMNNSLDMSRIEANAVEIQLNKTDLFSLAQDWHQSAEGMRHMRNKEIDITLDVAPDMPRWVYIDGPHVTQIVSNLVDNAIKFTDEGNVNIALSSSRSDTGEAIDIRVRDTGGGIPEDARVRVFDSFTQADSGLLRAHGGSGLGLSISSELARLMGATLSLEDLNGDGFTTVFLLRLDNVALVDLPT